MLEVAPGWIRVCVRGELLGVCMCTHLSLWSTYYYIVIILFEMPFQSTRSSLVPMQILHFISAFYITLDFCS
jgi:hypothetical protein